jgi:hypothetical protein
MRRIEESGSTALERTPMGAMGSMGFSRQSSICPPPGMIPPWVNDGPPWPLTSSPDFSRPSGVLLDRPPLARDRRPSFAICEVPPLL